MSSRNIGVTWTSAHDFKAIRWWDNWHHLGRCRACYVPRVYHPMRGETVSRPLGDTQAPTFMHDVRARRDAQS